MGRLVLLLLLPSLVAAQPLGDFPDLRPDDPDLTAIRYMRQEDIMAGYPDGTFRAFYAANRAELMKILVEAAVGRVDPEQFRDCFPDVQREWFSPYVCYAKSKGWVSGYPDGLFRPSQPVLVIEAIKMLVASRGYALQLHRSERVYYRLFDGIERQTSERDWFHPYLSAAAGHGIYRSGGYEEPLDVPIPRHAIARFIYKALLSEGHVLWHLPPPSDCEKARAVSFELSVTAFADIDGGRSAVERFSLLLDDASCLLTENLNPYHLLRGSVSENYLTPLLNGDPWQSARIARDRTRFWRMPLSDGRAYFLHSQGSLWVYDLSKETFSLLDDGVFAPHLLVDATRGLAFYVARRENAEVLRVLHLASGRNILLDRLTHPLAFDDAGAGTPLIEFTADAAIRYFVYRNESSCSGDVCRQEFTQVETRFADLSGVMGE